MPDNATKITASLCGVLAVAGIATALYDSGIFSKREKFMPSFSVVKQAVVQNGHCGGFQALPDPTPSKEGCVGCGSAAATSVSYSLPQPTPVSYSGVQFA